MKKLFFLSIPFVFISCTATLRYAKENNTKEEISFRYKRLNNIVEPNALETFTGVASYYADEFNGRKTANGEVFNMNDLTAAHISYPFNTICRVTNLKNQKSVIVRINDRKPDTNNREIDLSLKAAQEIEMINDGTAEVRVDILKWGGK
ncbi:MAG: septal ring lytic transglycosylase RlpA family protein [Ignavibacteriaceae bacterium]|jgi:rare lipoprotein A